MASQKTYTAILFLTVLLTAGSAATNTTEPGDTGNQFNATQISQNTTEYVSQTENTNITLTMNQTNKKYNLTWKTQGNFSENKTHLERNEAIQPTIKLQCKTVQQLSYNYQNFKNKITNLENPEPRKNKAPLEKFKNYQPNHIEGTLYNKNSSKKLAYCKPTKQHKNIKIRIN